MHAISDESRKFLVRISVMIVCGGIAILPFTVPPTSPMARAQRASRASMISVPSLPGKLSFPAISIARDPFVADAASLSVQARLPVTSDTSGSGDDIGIVLPPNAGAGGSPPAAAGASAIPVVRGIVLGDTPEALIDFGTGVKVVTVGDSIGSDTIRAIDGEGVTLSSGLRLRIVGATR